MSKSFFCFFTSSTETYFIFVRILNRVEKQNAKFNELVSEQSKRSSLDAFYKVGVPVGNFIHSGTVYYTSKSIELDMKWV